jgi:hypothetical protein
MASLLIRNLVPEPLVSLPSPKRPSYAKYPLSIAHKVQAAVGYIPDIHHHPAAGHHSHTYHHHFGRTALAQSLHMAPKAVDHLHSQPHHDTLDCNDSASHTPTDHLPDSAAQLWVARKSGSHNRQAAMVIEVAAVMAAETAILVVAVVAVARLLFEKNRQRVSTD